MSSRRRGRRKSKLKKIKEGDEFLWTAQETYPPQRSPRHPDSENYWTPPSTPYGTPPSSPYGTPYGTPPSTPYGTPPSSPRGTPPSTPYGTPYGTPPSTPYGTPYGTPASTPERTSPSVPEEPDDYQTRRVSDKLFELYSAEYLTSETVMSWHKMAVNVVLNYPERPDFLFLPTLDEIFRTAFDYNFITEKKIVSQINLEDTRSRWQSTHPEWVPELDELRRDFGRKAYIRQLVALMSGVKRDVLLVREDMSNHWKLSRMRVCPQTYGHLLREPFLGVDLLISDFDLIGLIAIKWAGY